MNLRELQTISNRSHEEDDRPSLLEFEIIFDSIKICVKRLHSVPLLCHIKPLSSINNLFLLRVKWISRVILQFI